MLILQKNKNYVEGGKFPYFTLKEPPKEDGGKWQELGAFWVKNDKNGNKYYSGNLKTNARIVIENIVEE